MNNYMHIREFIENKQVIIHLKKKKKKKQKTRVRLITVKKEGEIKMCRQIIVE
jgi:hypothetical protein